MKNIIIILVIIITNNLAAQIYIGQNNNSTINSSLLLYFEKTNDRGLILPTISELPINPTDGTILLDGVNETQARIKYRKNSNWQDISLIDGDARQTRITKNETIDSKVILGSENSNADGVLVLESKSMVMELPHVTSTDNILNPAPGMITYVYNSTIDKPLLAIYNGTYWTYWTHQIPKIGIDAP